MRDYCTVLRVHNARSCGCTTRSTHNPKHTSPDHSLLLHVFHESGLSQARARGRLATRMCHIRRRVAACSRAHWQNVSRRGRNLTSPSSQPNPLCFMPPKGVAVCSAWLQFVQTTPTHNETNNQCHGCYGSTWTTTTPTTTPLLRKACPLSTNANQHDKRQPHNPPHSAPERNRLAIRAHRAWSADNTALPWKAGGRAGVRAGRADANEGNARRGRKKPELVGTLRKRLCRMGQTRHGKSECLRANP